MKIFFFRRFFHPMMKIYWKVFHPKTFGVKAIIPNPKNSRQVLLIRNSYGNRQLWNIPGGGYNPSLESADEAVAREVREELSVTVSNVQTIGEYRTDAEGKHDTVTIFLCWGSSDQPSLSNEIAEFKWFSVDAIEQPESVARVALYAVELYSRSLGISR